MSQQNVAGIVGKLGHEVVVPGAQRPPRGEAQIRSLLDRKVEAVPYACGAVGSEKIYSQGEALEQPVVRLWRQLSAGQSEGQFHDRDPVADRRKADLHVRAVDPRLFRNLVEMRSKCWQPVLDRGGRSRVLEQSGERGESDGSRSHGCRRRASADDVEQFLSVGHFGGSFTGRDHGHREGILVEIPAQKPHIRPLALERYDIEGPQK